MAPLKHFASALLLTSIAGVTNVYAAPTSEVVALKRGDVSDSYSVLGLDAHDDLTIIPGKVITDRAARRARRDAVLSAKLEVMGTGAIIESIDGAEKRETDPNWTPPTTCGAFGITCAGGGDTDGAKKRDAEPSPTVNDNTPTKREPGFYWSPILSCGVFGETCAGSGDVDTVSEVADAADEKRDDEPTPTTDDKTPTKREPGFYWSPTLSCGVPGETCADSDDIDAVSDVGDAAEKKRDDEPTPTIDDNTPTKREPGFYWSPTLSCGVPGETCADSDDIDAVSDVADVADVAEEKRDSFIGDPSKPWTVPTSCGMIGITCAVAEDDAEIDLKVESETSAVESTPASTPDVEDNTVAERNRDDDFYWTVPTTCGAIGITCAVTDTDADADADVKIESTDSDAASSVTKSDVIAGAQVGSEPLLLPVKDTSGLSIEADDTASPKREASPQWTPPTTCGVFMSTCAGDGDIA